ELRSLAWLAADLDRPAMVGDDAVDDRKSEPGRFADILGGEEGFKDPLPRFGVHAAPGIRNSKTHEIAALRQTDGDCPDMVTDRLHGIGDEVYDNLLDLAGVGEDEPNVLDLLADQHHRGDGRAQHLKGFARDQGKVRPRLRHLLMSAEGENAS